VEEYKEAVRQYDKVQRETMAQHWIDWLEEASGNDIYKANEYLTSEPTDYSSARIPSLKVTVNGVDGLAEDNDAKAKALADVFFHH
jgi:hypothetical protein